ncbi:MAG TPA: efflux RND transporter periplasmic adaptor subunit [Pirellulales bacterium]|jgi:RND family efflux transporter MFP subunit|nr:efflux RND transporter periplasmic adaptor subunit [Pirellulales bacterium]
MTRKVQPALFIFLAVAVESAGGCNKTAAPSAESKPPKVTVQTPVFSQVTDEDSYTGWLRPSEKVEVRARVRGHIKKVAFHDGDMVTKEQLLFELDPRPFQTQIDQALSQAKAIDAQRIALQRDVERYTELVKTRAVTQQQLDKAIADVGYAEAQVAAKMEEVNGLRLDLEYAKVTAPIAGRIGRAQLTEGNLVNAGGSDPVLTTIVAVDPISLYFSVDEPALQKFLKTEQDARAKSGTELDKRPLRERKIKIRFGLETDEGYPHEATLDFANNEIDSTTGTIEVRAEVKNPNGLFAPGYRVRVRVPVGAPYDAILVPESAVNTDQDRKYLLTVDAKRIVKRCDVRLGRLLDNGMQVVSAPNPPLAKDTQIIVEGMQRARLNYPVEPIAEPAPTQTAAQ